MSPVQVNSKGFGLLSWFRLWWSGTGLLSRFPQQDIPQKNNKKLVISFTVSWSSFSPLCFLWPSLLSNIQPVPNYLHRFPTDFVVLSPRHSWPCTVPLMPSPRCHCPCKIVIPERSQIISTGHLWTLVTSPLTTHGIQPFLTVLAVTSLCFLRYYQWRLENFSCCHGLTSSSFPHPVQLI